MKTSTIAIRPLATLKLATLALLALVLLFLNACHWVGLEGNGDVVNKDRAVGDFTKIEADGAFVVNWTAAATPKLSITTDSNLFDYLRTDISGETLHIEWVKPLRGTHGIKVNVSSPKLTNVVLNGAVRFNAANLSGPEFYLDATGATRVTLQGNVNALSGEMTGASRLDAESLVTRAMELNISGAGKAEVNVSDALKVTISGAGKVTYSGDPQVSRDISGAGSVRKRE